MQGFSLLPFILLLTCLMVSAHGQTATGEASTRPNIIFLLTDDQRAGTFSVDGHPIIQTPNIDRLAAGGIRFTNAFVVEPTCMPSRASYFTGMYERVHGIGFTSEHTLSEQQWADSYPALLRASGYHTGFIGKLGLERYAFRGKAAAKFDFWRGHDGWARFYPKTAGNCAIYDDAKDDIITPIMGESIERFLDARPEGRPFCLSVSFSAPHGSISGSMCPEEGGLDNRMTRPANTCGHLKDHPIYGALYRDRDIPIPDDVATDPGVHIPPTVLDQTRRRRTYSYDYARETCREHHIRYYQLITGIDKVVGDLLDSLRTRGLTGNTVIIYSSDHGLLMGEYGMGGKALLYDLTTRVPLIIADPRLDTATRGTTIDQLVLSIDVPATILAAAAVAIPDAMQGRSLLPLMNDPATPWRNDIFLENLFTGRDNPLIEAVREKRWKYVRYFPNPGETYTDADVDFGDRPPIFEQLFDLDNDPGEKTNLTAAADHSDTLNRLRDACRAHSQDLVKLRTH
jgi:arylsulfatase A-like enzyme